MNELELFAYYQIKAKESLCFGCCEIGRSGFIENPDDMSLESIRESLLYLGETVADAEVEKLVEISQRVGRKIFLCDDCWRIDPLTSGERAAVLRLAWKYRETPEDTFRIRKDRLRSRLFKSIDDFHSNKHSLEYLQKAVTADRCWLIVGALNGFRESPQ